PSCPWSWWCGGGPWLEGLLGVVVGLGFVAGRFVAAAAAAGGAAGRAVAADLLDAGGGPAQRGADLVGHDLDLRALVAVLGLPGALLEAAGDDDAVTLGDGLRHVVGEVAPADDVEEGGLLLPLVVLHVAPVHGHAQLGEGGTAREVAQLGISGDVPDDGDGVSVGHWCLLL